MIVATAFSHTPTLNHEGKRAPFSNAQLAVKWCDWCARLGGIENTELVVLVPDEITLPPSTQFWKNVYRIRDRSTAQGWPYGPNSAFCQLAWAMHYRKGSDEPWLFCEPDCIPLKKSWLAELEDAYRRGGKPFMGVLVPAGPNFPDHMAGNGVYPARAVALAPSLVSEKKMNVAWDIRGAAQVVPKMQPTRLIHQLYRRPPFNSLEEFQATIPAEAVLFHSDKYGRIIQLLSGVSPHVAGDSGDNTQPAAATEPTSVNGEQPENAQSRPSVFSTAEICELISANIKSETARAKLMAYLHGKHFHQKWFGAAIKELAVNG